MDITRQNYEIYFVDYFEGKLNPDEVAGLKIFLSQNPDLEDEFSIFDEPLLTPERIIFAEKPSLKKFDFEQEINDSNLEQFLIAELEGDLPIDKKTLLQNFLHNSPSKQKIAGLVQKTKLVPNRNIVYPYKGKLKKYTIRKKIYQYSFIAAVAASLILFIFPFISGPKEQPMVNANLNDNTTKNLVQPERSAKIASVPVHNFTTAKSGYTSNKNNSLVTETAITVTEIQNRKNIERLVYLKPIEVTQIKIKSVTSPLQSNAFITHPQLYAHKENKNPKQFSIFIIKPTFINIADAGINGINKLFGSNMELNKKYDTQGNLTELAFNSEIISFSKTIKK